MCGNGRQTKVVFHQDYPEIDVVQLDSNSQHSFSSTRVTIRGEDDCSKEEEEKDFVKEKEGLKVQMVSPHYSSSQKSEHLVTRRDERFRDDIENEDDDDDDDIEDSLLMFNVLESQQSLASVEISLKENSNDISDRNSSISERQPTRVLIRDDNPIVDLVNEQEFRVASQHSLSTIRFLELEPTCDQCHAGYLHLLSSFGLSDDDSYPTALDLSADLGCFSPFTPSKDELDRKSVSSDTRSNNALESSQHSIDRRANYNHRRGRQVHHQAHCLFEHCIMSCINDFLTCRYYKDKYYSGVLSDSVRSFRRDLS